MATLHRPRTRQKSCPKKVSFASGSKLWDGLGPDEMENWRVVQAAEYLILWWFEKCKKKKGSFGTLLRRTN